MSTKWRRFEVLLPRMFNDGREVPGEWISAAILEVVDHFVPPPPSLSWDSLLAFLGNTRSRFSI